MGGGREGVHLEIRSDAGERFAVFRPRGARHRIVNVDRAVDVSEDFEDEHGGVSLLATAGIEAEDAKATMRISSADLLTTSERDDLIHRLAHLNQKELWVSAETLRSAQRRLDDEASAASSTAEDVKVIEQIELRHNEHERLRATAERIRRAAFILAGFAGLAVVPAAVQFGALATLPLVAVATVAVTVSVWSWRRVIRSAREEEIALTEFGAQSYLGFHIQRVNGLLSSDQARRQLMKAAEHQREALRRWQVIAGDVDLDWVMSNRTEIDAAARIRSAVFGGDRVTEPAEAEKAAGLAHTVVSRLATLRTMGPADEQFAALFDEPFADLDEALVPALLELLIRSSEHQQIVLLTNDPTVMSWARLEAMTGALSIVEPSPEPSDSSAVTLYDPTIMRRR
ncbi:MAG: hypothetical protein R2698_05975 [Microthrixaceae bacterium]